MRGKPDYNRALFAEVAKELRDIIGNGKVINPRENFGGDCTRPESEYLALALKQVLEADFLILLPEWQESEGARREVEVGIWAGKRFMGAFQSVRSGDEPYWYFKDADVSSPKETPSVRERVLTTATALVTGDRNNSYGPPTQDFRRSADAMTAYGYRHTQLGATDPDCPTCGARPLKPYDTAIAVDCVKTSRIMWSPAKLDHWIDKAGYSGCGAECASEEAS